jgi:hypothetical protein
MVVNDVEIDRLAHDLIARHGSRAARVAAQRLNEMIDRKNLHDRDIWACIVHVIHEKQGPSLVWPERPIYSHHRAPPLAASSRVMPHPRRAIPPLPATKVTAAN